VCLRACSNCTVSLPGRLEMNEQGKFEAPIKLFVEGCTDLVVKVGCRLVTSFVEISRCTGLTLDIDVMLHTIQCDLSKKLNFNFRSWGPSGVYV
jgi:hypothetical protein